jgi:hypothetical protein
MTTTVTDNTTTSTNMTENGEFRVTLLEPLLPNPTTTDEDPPPEVDVPSRHVALAWARTTPILIRLLLPILILSNHLIFYYGQTIPMWKLTSQLSVDWHYHAHSTEAQVALKTLHIPTSDAYVIPDHTKDLRTFTYGYAVTELWHSKDMTGTILPRIAAIGLVLFSGIWPHLKLIMLMITWFVSKHKTRRRRVLNALSILGKWSLVDVLVVCVMVGVLHLQWNMDYETIWASVLSHLPILASVVKSLYTATDICSYALQYSCVDPRNIAHQIECKACRGVVRNFLDHPDNAHGILKGIQVTGQGTAQMSVAGLPGIYYFCGAVILSITLSLVVDWYDDQSKQPQQHLQSARRMSLSGRRSSTFRSIFQTPVRRRLPSEEQANSVEPEVTGTLQVVEEMHVDEEEDDARICHGPDLMVPTSNETQEQTVELITTSSAVAASPDSRNNSVQQLLLAETGRRVDFRSEADRAFDRQFFIDAQNKQNRFLQCCSYVTIMGVVLATSSTTMQRSVHGGPPSLLHEVLGLEFAKSYSFLELGRTTGLAGGLDLMLMGTFVWFLIAGPILRSVLCVRASRICETPSMSTSTILALKRRHERMGFWIDFVGAFCAWEVFTAALVMVDLLMPSITSTIVMDPRCAQLFPGSTTCLEVEFDMVRNTYGLVILMGIVLVLVSYRIRNKSFSV